MMAHHEFDPRYGMLGLLTVYVGCFAYVMAMKHLAGYSDEALMGLGFFMIFGLLPAGAILLAIFAFPLVRSSQRGSNRHGPNPLEVTP